MGKKTEIKSFCLTELQGYLCSFGEPTFRAKQVYQWVHQKHVASFGEMTNLPLGLRERLEDEADLTALETVRVQASKLDGTRKYLFLLGDGNMAESVFMPYRHGNSVCISSQVGCRMGCRFCASTLGGLTRGLTPGEMLDQIYRIGRDVGQRISNVVVMGMGEPLDNYDNLLKFIELLTDENGLHISQRNLTVSTCGLAPQMRKLADEGLQITLALSLHAPTQAQREELMPIARKYGLPEVLGACKYYFEKTGRRVTFEYSLVRGANDSAKDAKALCALLAGMNCHINLIPVNPVAERGFSRPNRQAVIDFQRILEKNGLNATIRREMGADIDGACGQLRKRFME